MARDPREIHERTAAGSAEIDTATPGLSHASRRLLVLVDGMRDLETLGALVRAGEIGHLIADLETKGLVRLVGRSEPPNPDENRRLARARETSLARAKRMVAEVLRSEFGSAGHVWEARVADAIDGEVLRRLVRDGIDTLRTRFGEPAAQRAKEALKPLLGPGS